jgi:hypothetical protein
MSKEDKIIPYSPVNIIGRIIAKQAAAQEFLNSIKKKILLKKGAGSAKLASTGCNSL